MVELGCCILRRSQDVAFVQDFEFFFAPNDVKAPLDIVNDKLPYEIRSFPPPTSWPAIVVSSTTAEISAIANR
jgi:hypothetical protein